MKIQKRVVMMMMMVMMMMVSLTITHASMTDSLICVRNAFSFPKKHLVGGTPPPPTDP